MSEALPQGAAILVLGPGALPLARRLRGLLPGARLHAPSGSGIAADHLFDRAAPAIAALFAAGTPIVGLCAAGILIRAVAPLLGDKHAEPPVVAVAEDGSVAVPLLGGHRGANAMARAAAALIGGTAAITTAGDLRLGFALDEPPPGWRLANPARVKPVTAALLAERPVALAVEAGGAAWLTAGGRRFVAAAPLAIRVTDRAVAPDEPALVLHPPVLALGVGCERGCDAAELADLALAALAEAGLAPGAVAAVVSIDLKSDEPAVAALAARLGVPARYFSAVELLAETNRLATPSEAVFRETGCYGVAEGAALAAVGADGALLLPKRKSRARHLRHRARRSTARRGRARPRARQPRDHRHRPRRCDLAHARGRGGAGGGERCRGLRPLSRSARRRRSPARRAMRARSAPRRRGRGTRSISPSRAAPWRWSRRAMPGSTGSRRWSSSCIDREARPEWRRVLLSVVPGLSALQAAAARLGAPLGHDFCAISLSDLLTPWEVIERRLAAAAAGDFVVALYNPRSERRRTQLDRAREILLGQRAAETPVALARNLGRGGESIAITTLGALAGEEVDMLTLVLVGSSATRLLARHAAAALHAARICAQAPGAMTVHFIGAGPGAADLITLRGLAPHRALPGLPLCRLAGAAGDRGLGAVRGAGHRHRAADPRRDHRRDGGGACGGARGGAGPFRRHLAVRRHRRADAPARRRSALPMT